MESEWTLFWFTGIIALGLALFFVTVNNNDSSKLTTDSESSLSNLNLSYDYYSGSKILHWGHMPLRYFINSSCSSYQAGRIIIAFDYLKDETLGEVYFIENKTSPDLTINCLNESSPSKGYYRGGQAKTRSVDNRIFYAEINLYNETRDSGSCGVFMDTELHEILHIFGYNHRDDSLSIMSPISKAQCDVLDVDPEIIQELIYTYME